MAAIVNNNLAGLTITYNGVQWGGGDAIYPSTPPTYDFVGSFIYDDAGIAVKHTEYTLTCRSVFTGDDEGLMSDTMDELKLKLAQPGKVLKIEGLGTGFGTIDHDEEWGPKPQGFAWKNYGFLAWEVVWSVKFCIKECVESGNPTGLAFTAFNFSTSWQNDLEGLTRRIIDGYVEIVGKRKKQGNNVLSIPAHIADEVRDKVVIRVPHGFRRVANSWTEGAKKNQLRFTVVDEVMPGTAPPPGVIRARGTTSYFSEGPGVGNKGVVGINMDIITHPGANPALAGAIFLTAAMTKQQQLNSQQRNNAGVLTQKAVAIPRAMSIVNSKYDDARHTSASMSWTVTRCVGSLMQAAKIWEPLTPNDYTKWRTSVENLWDNRGGVRINGGSIFNDPSEAVIVDLCLNKTKVDFGRSSLNPSTGSPEPRFKFLCPVIPPDGGWIYQDLKIRILRKDKQTWHRKAISYLGSAASVIKEATSDGKIPLNDPGYEQSTDETKHDVEYHGLPELYVALQFRALRAQHKPPLPIIAKIGGIVPVQVETSPEVPFLAFDAFGCPVWGIRGYRIYRVNGYVSQVDSTESHSSCSKSDGGKTSY